MGQSSTSATRWRWTVVGVIAAVVIMCHGISLFGQFVFDDDILIRSNPTVKNPEVFLSSVFGPFFENTVNEGFLFFFRPFVLTSYFVTYQLFGEIAWPFHLTNLLIHAINGLLVFAFARRWFLLGKGPALLTACLFLAHPIQTESVSWISGRCDLLAATGIVGTLVLAWHWLRRPRALTLIGLIAVYHVGLLSKELTIITPALLALLVWVRWRSLRSTPKALWNSTALIGILGFLAVHFMMWRAVALADCVGPTIWATGDAVTTRLSIPKILTHYIQLVVWPHPYKLDYTSTNLGPVNSPHEILFWLPAIALILIWCYTAWLLLKRRSAGGAIGWFWITLAPVSQIKPLVVMATDHYMTVPIIGACVLAGMGYQRFAHWLHMQSADRAQEVKRLRRLVVALSVVSLLGLSIVNVQRCWIWRSNLSLFEYALSVDPHSHHKTYTLAKILLGFDRPADALEILRDLPEPENPIYMELLGIGLINTGETEAGLAALQASIRSGNLTHSVFTNLAQIHIKQGNFDQAEECLNFALTLREHDDTALAFLSHIQWERGDTEVAARTLEVLFSHNPDSLFGITERACQLQARGELDEASRTLWSLHRRSDPTVDSLTLLAQIDLSRSDWQRASTTLSRIIEIVPDSANALVDLGFAQAQMGEMERAVELWSQALVIEPDHASATSNLRAVAPQVLQTTAIK